MTILEADLLNEDDLAKISQEVSPLPQGGPPPPLMHGWPVAAPTSVSKDVFSLEAVLFLFLQVMGELDVLVNNAGMATTGAVLEGMPLLHLLFLHLD